MAVPPRFSVCITSAQAAQMALARAAASLI